MEYKKIEFGTYTNSYWHKLKGLKSVKALLKEIKELMLDADQLAVQAQREAVQSRDRTVKR